MKLRALVSQGEAIAIDEVRKLLERKASVSGEDLCDWLHVCAESENGRQLSQMIFAQARKGDREIANAMMQTCMREIAEWNGAHLLAFREALRWQSEWTFTQLLSKMCEARNYDGLDILLEDGCDTFKGIIIMSHLNQQCSAQGNLEIATRLARSATAKWRGSECMTQAIKAQRVDLIRMLQSFGICAPWPKTATTLLEAAALGDLSIARPLLQKASHLDLSQALSVAIELEQVAFATWLLQSADGRMLVHQVSRPNEWPSALCCAVAKKSSWALELCLSHAPSALYVHAFALELPKRREPAEGAVLAGGVGTGTRRYHPVDVAIDNGQFHHLFSLPKCLKRRVLPSLCISVCGSRSRERESLPFVRKWLAVEPAVIHTTEVCTPALEKLRHPLDFALLCGTWHIMRILLPLGAKMTTKCDVSIRSQVQDEVEFVRGQLIESVLPKTLAGVVVDYLEDDIGMLFARQENVRDK